MPSIAIAIGLALAPLFLYTLWRLVQTPNSTLEIVIYVGMTTAVVHTITVRIPPLVANEWPSPIIGDALGLILLAVFLGLTWASTHFYRKRAPLVV